MAAKKTKKKTASSKPNALEFCRLYLRKKPEAPFTEIRDAAKKKRITLYPISFGRAQALEGIVKVRPRGAKKGATAKTRGPGRPKGSKNKRGPGRPVGSKNKRGPGRPKGSKNKAGPGRPRKSRAALDSIEGLVVSLKTLQRERDDAVRAIDKIRNLLATL